jgi:hypothetical protein
MNDEAFIPKPRLDTIKPDLIRLKTTWMLCCSSPILYLMAANLIRTHWFQDGGLTKLTPIQEKVSLWIAGGIVAGLQIALLVVWATYRRKLKESASHLSTLIRVYSRRTFFMMALSEIAALLGFALFLVNGQLPIVFAFGVASMLLYAQSYPSERGLASAARQG